MPTKKKRSPKQKAALKKMQAGLKKWRSKQKKKTKRKSNPRKTLTSAQKTKKAKSKKYIKRKSQATGKKPSKRLQKRRSRNIQTGTFPNPKGRVHKNYYVVTVKSNGKSYQYFNGLKMVNEKKKAAVFHDMETANDIAKAVANKLGKQAGVLIESKR